MYWGKVAQVYMTSITTGAHRVNAKQQDATTVGDRLSVQVYLGRFSGMRIAAVKCAERRVDYDQRTTVGRGLDAVDVEFAGHESELTAQGDEWPRVPLVQSATRQTPLHEGRCRRLAHTLTTQQSASDPPSVHERSGRILVYEGLVGC
jgi:hypothetical protein